MPELTAPPRLRDDFDLESGGPDGLRNAGGGAGPEVGVEARVEKADREALDEVYGGESGVKPRGLGKEAVADFEQVELVRGDTHQGFLPEHRRLRARAEEWDGTVTG